MLFTHLNGYLQHYSVDIRERVREYVRSPLLYFNNNYIFPFDLPLPKGPCKTTSTLQSNPSEDCVRLLLEIGIQNNESIESFCIHVTVDSSMSLKQFIKNFYMLFKEYNHFMISQLDDNVYMECNDITKETGYIFIKNKSIFTAVLFNILFPYQQIKTLVSNFEELYGERIKFKYYYRYYTFYERLIKL